ncbi:hypothetical protein ACWD3D_26310, partial [Streptomyces sp. NPDC002690]
MSRSARLRPPLGPGRGRRFPHADRPGCRRGPQIPRSLHELTVGQLAARSGAAVSALHFYES